MAVELTIQEGRWSPRRLRAFVDQWAGQSPVRILSATPWETNRHGTWSWLFGEGSVRGCSIRLRTSLVKSGVTTVRLNQLASRVDWQMAYALVRGLLKTGGGRAVGPDGRVLRPEDLSDNAVNGEALAALREDASNVARELQRGQAFAALPNPAFSLILTAALLPKESDPSRMSIALEEFLRSMAARYHDAAPLPVSELPDASTITMWSGEPALFFLAHHFALAGSNGPDDGFVLPTEHALQLLGSRLEVVSGTRDRFYVPGLVSGNAEDEALWSSLAGAAQPMQSFMTRFQQQQESLF